MRAIRGTSLKKAHAILNLSHQQKFRFVGCQPNPECVLSAGCLTLLAAFPRSQNLVSLLSLYSTSSTMTDTIHTMVRRHGLHIGPDYIGEHIKGFPVSKISDLAPYSALILCVVLIVLFLIKFYVMELFLMRRLYGTKYTDLDEINRRGFVNNHIAGATKALILIVGVYPFIAVAFGKAHFHTPFAYSSLVTLGDVLLVCAQMLTGMFIFELIYRVKISPVSMFHHIGSILVAQAAISISINQDKDASIEFVLCTVWGKLSSICPADAHVFDISDARLSKQERLTSSRNSFHTSPSSYTECIPRHTSSFPTSSA
jgi:hypothetical protein